MSLISSIEEDWEGEGGREADLEVCIHSHPVPIWVFFLSLPDAPEGG